MLQFAAKHPLSIYPESNEAKSVFTSKMWRTLQSAGAKTPLHAAPLTSLPGSPGLRGRPPGAGGPRLRVRGFAAAPQEDTGSARAGPGRPAPRSASPASHPPDTHTHTHHLAVSRTSVNFHSNCI